MLVFATLLFASFNNQPVNAAPPPINYSYWVRIPAMSLSCDEEAQLLGQRFAQATKAAVQAATCQNIVTFIDNGVPYTLYSLLVTYQAAMLPSPYFAQFGYAGNDVGNITGAYDRYQDCLADIAEQNAIFESQTGLMAVSTSCQPTRGQLVNPAYVLQIDGFGIPAKRLRIFEPISYASMSAEDHAEIDQLLESQGARIAKRFSKKRFHYAAYGVHFRHDSFARFDSGSQCTAQLTEIEHLYQGLFASATWIRCLPMTGAPGEDRMSLEAITTKSGIPSSDYGYSSPKYYSFEECMSDRDRRRTQRSLAVLCHKDLYSDFFIMELLSAI